MVSQASLQALTDDETSPPHLYFLWDGTLTGDVVTW